MQIIPFKDPAQWNSQIALTNVIFLLSFKWNALNKFWAMTIYDRNGDPIIYGIKVVTNFDLTRQFVNVGLPAGSIICQNILNEWFDIERFSMGQSNELIYYEPQEAIAQAQFQLANSNPI